MTQVRRRAKKRKSSTSSDESSSDGEDSEEEVQEQIATVNGAGHVNGVDAAGDDVEEDASARAEEETGDPMEEDDGEEATFGERLSAQTAEPIDVEAVLAEAAADSSDEASHSKQRALARVPAGATFSTVLTQALRTNDHGLLDTCFETGDLESVRETLSRIDSRLVVPLMQRIAEKVTKGPGRLGNLMVWIQWAIIAHGGFLAGVADIKVKMRDLHKVIEMRAEGLPALLQLKGKLDMLSAQLDVRKEEQERRAMEDEDEDGPLTVYIEGEDDGDSDSDSEALDDEQRELLNGLQGSDEEMESDDEGANLGVFANGVVRGDVERSDDSEDENELIDDEAEEDDEEEDEEEDSDEEDSD